MTRPSSLQRCACCGTTYGEREPLADCLECGGLLEIEHEITASASELRAVFRARRAAQRGPDASGVWRYRELVLPSAEDDIVSHPEGNTPLLARRALSAWCG